MMICIIFLSVANLRFFYSCECSLTIAYLSGQEFAKEMPSDGLLRRENFLPTLMVLT